MAVINIAGVIPSIGDLTNTIPIGISPLGTPVFDDVTFQGGNYIDNNGFEIEYEEMKLQSVQLTVNQTKNIVKTSVAGLNGTIKERISDGDFEVNITAKVTELFNVFPYDQLERFEGVRASTEPVTVICRFLNEIFKIDKFVIEDITLSSIAGSINEADLSIRMTSDFEIDFGEFEL